MQRKKQTAKLKKTAKPMYGVGVSVLLMNAHGRLLLAKRKNNTGAGLLSTPGGRLEYYESVEECAAREFKEECGTTLGPVTLLKWKKLNRFGKHYFMFYVLATTWGERSGHNEIKNCIPDKSEDWSWVSMWTLTEENCTEPKDIIDILDQHFMRTPTNKVAVQTRRLVSFEKCKNCDGRGWNWCEVTTCITCQGTGKVKA